MRRDDEECLQVVVSQIADIAEGIRCFELRAPHGGQLAPFTAGAHIDVHMGPALVRQYSLCNNSRETDRYVIAVQHQADGQGGSNFMHAQVQAGTHLQVSRPRNHFPLAATADLAVLIAGGIGVTPIWAMVQELHAQGRPWKAYLYARDRMRAPFFEEISALGGNSVVLRFGDNNGEVLEIPEIAAGPGARCHLYCCGPAGMLRAFEQSTGGTDAGHVHLERFQPVPAGTDGDQPVELLLAKSMRTVKVASDQTLLQALALAGVSLPSSCLQGYCGTCETSVLEGEAEHRDTVLTDAEREAHNLIMPCVSRAKSARLILDL